ncbi:hypothetical protein ACJX0J_023066, partial [Zea mays]
MSRIVKNCATKLVTLHIPSSLSERKRNMLGNSLHGEVFRTQNWLIDTFFFYNCILMDHNHINWIWRCTWIQEKYEYVVYVPRTCTISHDKLYAYFVLLLST